jgi:hypothetical protein
VDLALPSSSPRFETSSSALSRRSQRMRLSAVDLMNGSCVDGFAAPGTCPQNQAVTSTISHENKSPSDSLTERNFPFGPTNGYCPLLSRLRQCETFLGRRNVRSCSLSKVESSALMAPIVVIQQPAEDSNSAYADLRCASLSRPRASLPCSEGDYLGHSLHDGIHGKDEKTPYLPPEAACSFGMKTESGSLAVLSSDPVNGAERGHVNCSSVGGRLGFPHTKPGALLAFSARTGL